MADKNFMDPMDKIGDKADKLKKAGQNVAKSTTKSPDQKIKARELLKKVIQGLPWEAKKAALDIIRAEISSNKPLPASGTMDTSRVPVDYTAKGFAGDDEFDTSDYTPTIRKKERPPIQGVD
jgi:hypothetical protein